MEKGQPIIKVQEKAILLLGVATELSLCLQASIHLMSSYHLKTSKGKAHAVIFKSSKMLNEYSTLLQDRTANSHTTYCKAD